MTAREESHGFLPIVGTRVFVTGTKHHGFRGVVVDPVEGMSPRAIRVQLDEWDEPLTFYNHNLLLADFMENYA